MQARVFINKRFDLIELQLNAERKDFQQAQADMNFVHSDYEIWRYYMKSWTEIETIKGFSLNFLCLTISNRHLASKAPQDSLLARGLKFLDLLVNGSRRSLRLALMLLPENEMCSKS